MALTRVDFPALRSPVTRILDEVSTTRVRKEARWDKDVVRRRERSWESVAREREGRRAGSEAVGEVGWPNLRSRERIERGW